MRVKLKVYGRAAIRLETAGHRDLYALMEKGCEGLSGQWMHVPVVGDVTLTMVWCVINVFLRLQGSRLLTGTEKSQAWLAWRVGIRWETVSPC